MNYRHWPPDEDATLRTGYTGRGGAQRVADQLGRTVKSVMWRAEKLGLKTHARWTGDEDRRLRNLWGEKTVKDVCKLLGRTPIGVMDRARKLGLPIGCPDGCEYLTAAADRVGFSVEGVRSICRWAGVVIRPAMVMPAKGQKGRWMVVDSFELDEAVKAYLKTETVNEAARRLGIGNQTLTRRLVAAGVPRKAERKQHWRIPSDVIDRAMGVAA